MSLVGIVLAGGKGKRFGAVGYNKTTALFRGKPLVMYGVDLYKGITDKTMVVVGELAESVKLALDGEDVLFINQKRRLGTGHALKVAIREIEKLKLSPEAIFLGYGDHMMCYTKEIVQRLLVGVRGAAVAMIIVDNPNGELAWGRIIRNEKNEVLGIVEQKDATDEQRLITELNAGFYCFDYEFVRRAVNRLKKSPVSGEYYATDLISMAVKEGKKVVGIKIALEEAGLGVNTQEELARNEQLVGGKIGE